MDVVLGGFLGLAAVFLWQTSKKIDEIALSLRAMNVSLDRIERKMSDRDHENE